MQNRKSTRLGALFYCTGKKVCTVCHNRGESQQDAAAANAAKPKQMADARK